MTKEHPTHLATHGTTIDGSMWLHRPATLIQALQETAPGETYETPKEELLSLREIIAEAMDEVLTEGERAVFDGYVVERRSLRNFNGVPKTTVARHRDNAIQKLQQHLIHHPFIRKHLAMDEHEYKEFLLDMFPTAHVLLIHPPDTADTGMSVRETARQTLVHNGHKVTVGDPTLEIIPDGITAVAVMPDWSETGSRNVLMAAFKAGKPTFVLNAETFNPQFYLTRQESLGQAVWEMRPL